MSDDFRTNPLLQSLWEIHKPQLVEDFFSCYQYSKKTLGEEFNKTMEDMSIEILELKSKCKEETGILSVTLLLCMCDDEDECSKEESEESNKHIKACAVWLMLNKKV